jgi:hypothetical protein
MMRSMTLWAGLCLGSGELARGIFLPEAFRSAIEAAL